MDQGTIKDAKDKIIRAMHRTAGHPFPRRMIPWPRIIPAFKGPKSQSPLRWHALRARAGLLRRKRNPVRRLLGLACVSKAGPCEIRRKSWTFDVPGAKIHPFDFAPKPKLLALWNPARLPNVKMKRPALGLGPW